MTSLVASVLYVVASVWLLLMVWIAADRYRHERRLARLAAVKQRLHRSSPGDVVVLHAVVSQLSIAQLDAMILDGLPPAMEIAVAIAMEERSAQLLREARGGGSVWRRISAVRVLAAARSDRRYECLDKMLRSGTPWEERIAAADAAAPTPADPRGGEGERAEGDRVDGRGDAAPLPS